MKRTYLEPLDALQGALRRGPAARGGGRDRRWMGRSHKPRPWPGRGRNRPRRSFAASRPNRFRDRRATRGRRRRRRSPCRSSMTSSRPAEYGFGDWQARNAACGAEFIRFRAICGHFGTNSTARTSISQPGVTLTPSPARHTWSTPSPTASPPPAPAGTPRLAFSVEARRRPADIRESSVFRRDTRKASRHRLAPSCRASG